MTKNELELLPASAAPRVLDPGCGSKMFYADKNDDRVLFCDNRAESHTLCDGRRLIIAPDCKCDFRDLPFKDGSFALVIFDPPHLIRAGEKSWIAKKYGVLNRDTWQADLRQGFAEAFRVLAVNGTLIFKWSEKDIRLADVLALTPHKPLVTNTGKIKYPFHWCVFFKAAGAADREGGAA